MANVETPQPDPATAALLAAIHALIPIQDLQKRRDQQRDRDDNQPISVSGAVVRSAAGACEHLLKLSKLPYRPPVNQSVLCKVFSEEGLAHVTAAMKTHGFGEFASMHEVYGALAEEVAELLDAIRRNHKGDMLHELWDCATVALFGITCLQTWMEKEKKKE